MRFSEPEYAEITPDMRERLEKFRDERSGDPLGNVADRVLFEDDKVRIWEMKLEPEEQKPCLLHNGFTLPDDSLVSSHGLVHNELLYLNFVAPWEPDEPAAKAGGDKGGGKKKK